MKVALVGCAHGNLNTIYDCLDQSVDLVIIAGDFQAVRSPLDLESMAVPLKYRVMGDFPDYVQSGAPILTLVIGGNHEASNHFNELPNGGWLAKNIYYIGRAGVVQFRGHRIAGLSGIFYAPDYQKPHHETLPFDKNEIHSIYHVRLEDVDRLMQLPAAGDMTIMVSHDWPQNIAYFGNVEKLLRKKPYFRKDLESGKLGSPPAAQLLTYFQPKIWLSAHLHCHFEAWKDSTHFIALDKPLPKRKFFEIITIPDKSSSHLEYDPQWLGVLKYGQAIAIQPFAMPEFGTNQTQEFHYRLDAATKIN